MTPRPANLPQNPRDLTAEQALSEAIRILRNMGGPEYGAGYSWGLAERLEGCIMLMIGRDNGYS